MTPKQLTNTLEIFFAKHQEWATGRTVYTPPALHITGSPGTGKSTIPQTIARRLGMTPLLIDGTSRDAIDMSGLPDILRVDGQAPRTIRAVPDIVTEVERIAGPSVLIFDDFPSLSRLLQAACASALLSRTISGYPLPRECYVMATGNLATDRVVYHDLPTNVWNRMIHLTLTASTDDWCDWAIAQGFDARLVAAVREEGFSYTEERWVNFKDPRKAFCTPRSLEFVNRILGYGLDAGDLEEAIAGAVGTVPGAQLWARIKLLGDLPAVADILREPERTRLPEAAGSKYVLARTIALRMDAENSHAAVTYLERLGRDYLIFAVKFRLGLETREPERMAKVRGQPVTVGMLPGMVEFAARNPGLGQELRG